MVHKGGFVKWYHQLHENIKQMCESGQEKSNSPYSLGAGWVEMLKSGMVFVLYHTL